MTAKRDLRRAVLACRDALSGDEIAARSARAGELLFALPEMAAAGLVMFFISFGSEIDTVPVLARALASGKRIAAPQADRQARVLVPREVRDPARDLVPGAYGIREPTSTQPPLPLDSIQVVIVPAAAWGEDGFRVGYGAGYYDRFLPQVPQACWIGLGLELQVVREVPHGPRDLPVDILVTDVRVRRFGRRGR